MTGKEPGCLAALSGLVLMFIGVVMFYLLVVLVGIHWEELKAMGAVP